MLIATNIPLMMKSGCVCLLLLASSDKYGLNIIKYRCRCSSIAGKKACPMVNQILTRQELMLSFLLQALVHMEFKEDHKQYVNQVTHAGEEKEQFSTRIKCR